MPIKSVRKGANEVLQRRKMRWSSILWPGIYGTYEPEGEDNVLFIIIKVSAHGRFHKFCRLRP